VANSLPFARLPSPLPVDCTLEVVDSGEEPVFPLGVLVTCAVDVAKCSLTWEEGTLGYAPPGCTLTAVLRLVRGDGQAASVPCGLVNGTAIIDTAAGAWAGAWAGAGGSGSGPSVPVAVESSTAGTYKLSVLVPADGGATTGTLTLRASLRGVGDIGAPLTLPVRPLLAFDHAAGSDSHRTLGQGGSTLTTVTVGHLFRGRTPLLRAGPGAFLDIGLELRKKGSSTFTIALGVADHIKDKVYDYSSNTGLAFFWEVSHGGVNAPWGTGTGHYKQPSSGSLVAHFRIRDNTLTFKAGPSLDAMTLQRGQWTLPNDFYLLIAGTHEGSVVRLFNPPPGAW
jgi:hypothetical protein